MALLLNIALIHCVKFLKYALQLHIDRLEKSTKAKSLYRGKYFWTESWNQCLYVGFRFGHVLEKF